MQSERWQSCTEIFSDVVERPHNARAALLERKCNGDDALRRKVELLLKYHDKSDDFIDSPAFVVAPELLVADPDALIGQHLGPYRIDAVLGSGGMGVVYLAYDERLARKVGLKLLPQSMLTDQARWERLKLEARAASALNHPNIMTIHEVGKIESKQYIATEYIEGTTLRKRMTNGPIPPNETVDIAIQVANALCVAHNAGIVHRDVKPENIMLRPDGYVKVLDFGIAKFTDHEPLRPATSNGAEVTAQQGMILGTTRYMSPEQARGQTVDARSDLWSLGVVLYEMLTGRPPFQGETPSDVMAAVLMKAPGPFEPPAVVPQALQSILERTLRKDPAERYQSAEEMLSELRAIKEHNDRMTSAADGIGGHYRPRRTARWIGVAVAVVGLLACVAVFFGLRNRPTKRPGAPASIEKGIAVLPFENLSAEKDDAFFTDGIQDDILTSVGKIKDLKVIARASVMDYRGARLAGKMREIGEASGVSHVLEGSVRRVANRVVMNVALIDTRDQRQVWSERYERTLADTISLQGDLAIEIARALQTKLTPAEAMVATTKPTQDPAAYLLYLRAREIEIQHDYGQEVEAAVELYQQAIDLDPDFALARARLSICASRRFDGTELPQWKRRARTEAEEAIRLQPELGEARLALTQCYLWGDKDYERALAELARAADLLPNSAEVQLTAAFIYKRQDRYRDRLTALRRAEILDPRNRKVLSVLAMTHRWVRDWPEALQAFERRAVLQDQPDDVCSWAHIGDKFVSTGDIKMLKSAITGTRDGRPLVEPAWQNVRRYQTAMLERDYAEAARFISDVPRELLLEAIDRSEGHSKAFYQALAAVAGNIDATAKQRALEIACNETERRLSFGPRGDKDEKAHADLALLYAFSGRKEEAIGEALRAVEVTVRGIVEKNDMSSALALVYARTDEQEKAIDLIEHLLTVPTELQRDAVHNMTLTDLKLSWVWDPLRSNPRFQKILASPEPKTAY